ncbi:MAG: hypothetical protein KF712_15745 [Akkermansiaceae bacterium]|nr:hypothetical protein [Akkermansiaceae bacterium]
MSNDQIAIILLIVLGMIASYFIRKRFGKGHQEAADELGMRLAEEETKPRNPARPEEVALMRGEMNGMPAMVFLTGLPGNNPKKRKRMLKARTHLALESREQFPVGLMLEPILPEALYGSSEAKMPVVVTGDDAFDRVFQLSTDNAAEALRLIDGEFRRQWLEFRKSLAPQARDDTMSRTAVNLLMGRLVVEPDRLVYSRRGTPDRKVAGHLKSGVALVLEIFKEKK